MTTHSLFAARVRVRQTYRLSFFPYLHWLIFACLSGVLIWQGTRGSAKVLNSFIQQSQVTASDGATSDHFGRTVALSGETMLVGAPGDNVGVQSNQGSAYVFRRTGSGWTQEAQLFAPDGVGGDGFGNAVALSGDVAVVAAAFDDRAAGFNVGSVHVFRRTGVTWNFEQQLTPSNPGDNDRFGSSVAVAGDTIVVGAPMKTSNQGAAYVFRFANGTWTQETQLFTTDSAAGDEFGIAVAVQGDKALVGAAGKEGGKGAAYIFGRNGTMWVQQAILSHLTLDAGDRFGQSVALSNNTALIGAPQGLSTNQGAAYVFTQTSGLWNFQAQLLANDGAAGDEFGQAVALVNDTALVGAPLDDVGTAPSFLNQGSAYVFTRSGTSWSQQQQLTVNGGVAEDQAGLAVALDSQTAVLGVWLRDITANNVTTFDQGAVYVYGVGSVTCPTITISPATLPSGTINAAYQQALLASGGAPPYTFTLTAGSLPSGLNFAQGSLSGVPTQSGTFNLTVQATDANNCTSTQSYTLTIANVVDPCAAGGCILTATPNPIQVCDNSGLGVATLNWSAPNIAQTALRIGSANGAMLASGGATGSATTGKWVSNGMQFFLVNAVTGATLASTTVHLTTANCPSSNNGNTLTATPNPIQVCDGSGVGATTLTWYAPVTRFVEVRVGSQFGVPIASGINSGAVQTGKWVTEGLQFFLVNAVTGAILTSTRVSVTSAGCANAPQVITATPAIIQVCDGTGLGVTTIRWNAPGNRVVEVRVDSPTGPLFAAGHSTGAANTGKWVSSGMQFFLINADTGTTLGSVTATVHSNGCPTQ